MLIKLFISILFGAVLTSSGHSQLKHNPIKSGIIPAVAPLKKQQYPNNFIYHWDTIYCYDTSGLTSRLTESLNEFGLLTYRNTDKWQNFHWENSERENYTYDDQGNLLEQVIEKWQNNTWLPYKKNVNVYNGAGDRISDQRFTGNGSNWINFRYYTYTYLSPGEIDTCTTMTGTPSGWENSFKSGYSWDSDGNLIRIVDKKWISDHYELFSMDTLIYNSQGSMTEYFSKLYEYPAWINNYHEVCTYDSSQNEISTLEQIWENTEWVNFYLMNYTYDSLSRKTEYYSSWWDNSSWQSDGRILYFYDSVSNLIREISQNYMIHWEDAFKQEYTYDENGNSVSGKYYMHQITNEWAPAVGSIRIYSNFQFELNIDSIHSYAAHISSFPVGISERKADHLLIYPNPGKSFINLKLPDEICSFQIKIIDLTGKVVLEETMKYPDNQINISNLVPGIYLVLMNDGKQVRNARLIVNR